MSDKAVKESPRIFLVYTTKDSEIAYQLKRELRRTQEINIQSAFDVDLFSQENPKSILRSNVASSDYIIVFLSKEAVNSPWINWQLSFTNQDEIRQRNINIIPVLLETCEIPLFLREYPYIDLRNNRHKGIRQIINQVISLHLVDFNRISAITFERLAIDLLSRLGFSKISSNHAQSNDYGIDMIANLCTNHPLLNTSTETWGIEISHYRSKRISVKHILKSVSRLKMHNIYRLLIITSSQLTSAASEFVNDVSVNSGSIIRVIDELELKKLVISQPEILHKYFDSHEHN